MDVAIELGHDTTASEIASRQPSVVLLATGSTPMSANLPTDGAPVFGPYDAPATGGHVVVQDEIGRLGALLTAERPSEGWDRVTLVTSSLYPGEGEGITTAYSLLRALARKGIRIVDRARLLKVEGRTAFLAGVFDEAREPVEGVDAVVSLAGAISRTPLLVELRAAHFDVRPIGDARLPRNVTAAVQDAASTIWSLSATNADGETNAAVAIFPSSL